MQVSSKQVARSFVSQKHPAPKMGGNERTTPPPPRMWGENMGRCSASLRASPKVGDTRPRSQLRGQNRFGEKPGGRRFFNDSLLNDAELLVEVLKLPHIEVGEELDVYYGSRAPWSRRLARPHLLSPAGSCPDTASVGYMGTSLMRNCLPLRPYSRPMVLRWS